MQKRISRRDILRKSTGFGVGLWLVGSSVRTRAGSAGDKLNLAFVGIGGQGKTNLKALAEANQNIVALCDVDDERAGNAYGQYPWAKKHYDFRRMLEEEEKLIDAVVISTPDHTHVHPAIMAMRMGKHVYCEKPMAHSVWEVRAMTELAAAKRLATQLGVQRHANENIHRVVELVKSGAIGEVREVHSWIGGDRGMPAMPKEFPPVPPHLKWDLWLGPAEARPYSSSYCPYTWRFWWDFGTGETGNWGCHILDIPYWALDLRHPTRVEASGPPAHPQTSPTSMEVRFEFPGRGKLPPVRLCWYHTKSGPEILGKHGLPRSGNNLFVGTKGMLLCDFGKRKLFPESKFDGFQPPLKTIPDSPGFHQEWIAACTGGPPATCNFDYTGPMTEAILLGNVAYRSGEGIAWDWEHCKASGGSSAVAGLIHPPFAKGWEI